MHALPEIASFVEQWGRFHATVYAGFGQDTHMAHTGNDLGYFIYLFCLFQFIYFRRGLHLISDILNHFKESSICLKFNLTSFTHVKRHEILL